jgi:hypothetical protein
MADGSIVDNLNDEFSTDNDNEPSFFVGFVSFCSSVKCHLIPSSGFTRKASGRTGSNAAHCCLTR